MKPTFIAALLFLAGTAGTATAQQVEKENTDVKKEKHIITEKRLGSNGKMTIVINGDDITVNGKKIESLDMLDSIKGLKVFHSPDIRLRVPGGKMHLMEGDFDFKTPGHSATRAFLGVTSEKADKGIKITTVSKESAAAKAGLQKGDILISLNKEKMDSPDDLYEAVGKYKPDEKVTITYLRDGKENTTTATLGKTYVSEDIRMNFNRDFNFNMPQLRGLEDLGKMDFNFMTRKPRLGLEIQDMEEGKGVKVLDVDTETPAAKAGIQKEDIITTIDGKAVSSVDELKAALKDIKEGDTIKLGFSRNGKAQTADIKLPKKLKTADL